MLKNKIIVAFIALLPTITYANYTVTPVKVQIKPGSMISSLTLQNNDSIPHHFQLTLYKADDKGNTSDEETKDLIVSPSMFKVEAQKPQMIRVAIKNLEAASEHKHYILSVKELPHGKIEANTVKVVTDFRVPVLIGDKEEKNEEMNN
jgi:P pilus assembly chaperone PapD